MAYCLPARSVENPDLARTLGVDPARVDAIVAHGPRTRHYADHGRGPSDLAKVAADEALSSLGLGPADAEFLIFATMTPDVTFPGAGCYLQHKLGCGTIGALDVRAQCSGFLFGLDIATQFVAAGAYRRVLLAAGDVHSAGLDFSPEGIDTTPLYGDGAAVAIVDADRDDLLGIVLHADATDFERFWCEFPSSRRKPTRFVPSDLEAKRHYPTLDREFVERDGRERIRATVEEVLAQTATTKDRVAKFVFQHVYRGSALAAADALGVADRTLVGGFDEGHVASASLAITLCRARERGEVATGDLVCLATAGAGMTSAAAVLRV